MKTTGISNRTELVAFRHNQHEIDFYIQSSDNEMHYAFSRPFSLVVWNLCCSGIRVNDLISKHSRNRNIMLLIKRVKYLIPYLCSEYELETA